MNFPEIHPVFLTAFKVLEEESSPVEQGCEGKGQFCCCALLSVLKFPYELTHLSPAHGQHSEEELRF